MVPQSVNYPQQVPVPHNVPQPDRTDPLHKITENVLRRRQNSQAMQQRVKKFLTDTRYTSISRVITKVNEGTTTSDKKTYITLNALKMGVSVFGEELFGYLLFSDGSKPIDAMCKSVNSVSEAEKLLKLLSIVTGSELPHEYPYMYDHEKVCKYLQTERISSPVKERTKRSPQDFVNFWNPVVSHGSIKTDLGIESNREPPQDSEMITEQVSETINLNSDTENLMEEGDKIEHAFFVSGNAQ